MGYSNLKMVEWFSTQYQLLIVDDSINAWWRTRAKWYLKRFQGVFLSENESNFIKISKLSYLNCLWKGMQGVVVDNINFHESWPKMIRSILLDGWPGRLKGLNLWVVTKWIEFYEDLKNCIKKLHLKYPYRSHRVYDIDHDSGKVENNQFDHQLKMNLIKSILLDKEAFIWSILTTVSH